MFNNLDITLLFLFGGIATIAFALTLIAINYVRSVILRTLLVLLFATFLPLSYFSFTELIGQPKPYSMVWFKSHYMNGKNELKITILGMKLIEKKGIYLYIIIPNSEKPLSIVLPWNQKQAMNMQNAFRASRDSGKPGLKVIMQFEQSLDTLKLKLYDPPQQQSPYKKVQDPPQNYIRDSGPPASRTTTPPLP